MATKYSEAVIARYLGALARIGDMYSRQTVSMVLTLATEEAISCALQKWEAAAETEIAQLQQQLADLRYQNADIEKRRQDWQRQAEEAQTAAGSSFAKLADLRQYLVANGIADGDLVAAAIQTMDEQQDRIEALRAANETLHKRLAAPAAMPAAAPTNGNGSVAGIDWSNLSPEASDYRLGIERGSHTFRKLPITIRLEFVRCLVNQLEQPVTMADYDAIKPEWMPTANGLPRTFGASWADLPTLAAPVVLA